MISPNYSLVGSNLVELREKKALLEVVSGVSPT
jgi:hypothetical protein